LVLCATLAAIIDIPRIPPQTTLMSQTLPLIALGGALGSVLRYLMVAAIGAPWGTAAVNVLGSFAIGVLFILLDARTGWQLFLMTGLLGGFTTFSAFSLDTLKLIEAGQPLQAALYVLGSVALSLIAVALGVALARGIA
jgi:fluoride exporter